MLFQYNIKRDFNFVKGLVILNRQDIKILFITSGFPRNSEDNTARFVLDFVQLLLKNGYKVVVLAPFGERAQVEEECSGLKIYRFSYFFPRKWMKLAYGDGMIYNIKSNFFLILEVPFFFFSEFIYGLKIARKEKISVIHAQWLIPQGFVSLFIRFFYPSKVIVTVHGSDLRVAPTWFSKLILHHIDAVISPHPELTEFLQSIKISDVKEIPNVIDESLFNPDISAQELLDDLQIKTQNVVTFVARLNDFKDPVTFIRSIPYVIDQDPDVTFLIAGDGPLMMDIEHLINDLNIKKFIRILGNRKDISRILKISTVFTALSPYENIWSVTIIEAMTMGVPCIITDSGTTKRYLENNVDAILIPSRNPQKLATEIVNLIHDREKRLDISKNGKKMIERKFSSSKILKQYDDLLSSFCE